MTSINITAITQLILQLSALTLASIVLVIMWRYSAPLKRHWVIWVNGVGFIFLMGLRRVTAALIQFGLISDVGAWQIVDRFTLPLVISVMLLLSVAGILSFVVKHGRHLAGFLTMLVQDEKEWTRKT